MLPWPEVKFSLDLPRSKSICFDASWREKHDGAEIIPLSWFESYLRKTMHPQIAVFLLWTALDWSRYDLKRSTRVSLDSERRNSWAARQCLHEIPSNRADARGFNIQPVIGQCRKGKFTSLQFERFSVLRCIDVVNLIPTRRLLEEAGYVWPAHVASGG